VQVSAQTAVQNIEMGVLRVTTFGEDQPTAELGRFCPECGQRAGNSNFCSGCGHNMGFAADRTVADPALTPSGGGQPKKSHGRAGIIAAGVVGLVVIAVAVVVLINSHSGSSSASSADNAASVQSAGTTYRVQLTKVLAPVIGANQTVSNSLTAMNGSKQTTNTAKTRVAAALAALESARGGLKVLTVPAADTALSGQVQQALAADDGYLQAVSSTLATPAGSGIGQLQTLSTGAQSALVNLETVMPGASSSVNGTSNLVSWVQGATATHKAAAKQTQTVTSRAAAAAPAAAAQAPASTPQGLSACDQNISVNSATTCPFADNVFAAYASVVQDSGPTSADVTASSPATGQTYTDNCQYNAENGLVLCSHGTDLVQFPEWAASVYNP
jgi:hypothetical protein